MHGLINEITKFSGEDEQEVNQIINKRISIAEFSLYISSAVNLFYTISSLFERLSSMFARSREIDDFRYFMDIKNENALSEKIIPQFDKYEFEFKNLDGGNGGFTDALCLIWGLKGGENLCKSATKTQCDEISAAINRTFYIGGSAELKGANCVINSHPKAESAPIALFNTKVLTKEDLRAVNSIDSLHFYDKKLQVNANSDVYKSITNYLFVEQRLPIKQFTCGAGIVDNVPYYNISRTEYDAAQQKIR